MQHAPPVLAGGLVYGLPAIAPASLPPAIAAADGSTMRTVFVDQRDLKAIVIPETRSWIAAVGPIRIGIGAIPGRVITLIGLGEPGALGSDDEGRATWPPALGIAPALLAETESGEPVLLQGGVIRAVGRFEELGDGAVTWNDEIVERLDVTALYRWIEKQVWERSALVGPHGARISSPGTTDDDREKKEPS